MQMSIANEGSNSFWTSPYMDLTSFHFEHCSLSSPEMPNCSMSSPTFGAPLYVYMCIFLLLEVEGVLSVSLLIYHVHLKILVWSLLLKLLLCLFGTQIGLLPIGLTAMHATQTIVGGFSWHWARDFFWTSANRWILSQNKEQPRGI